MSKMNKDDIYATILQKIDSAGKVKSPADIAQLKFYFSSGRKFAHDSQGLHLNVGSIRNFNEKKQYPAEPVLNMFRGKSKNIALDLLTDSGTNTLTYDQVQFKKWYVDNVPSIEINSYAGATPKVHLNKTIEYIFGDHMTFYLAVQGRVAERLMMSALMRADKMKSGQTVLSNRPFDTTKGMMHYNEIDCVALTPLASPLTYINADNVFMGDIKEELILNKNPEDYSMILVTMTDNGGGGQPVSMKNLKFLAQHAKANKKLLWVDACRVFQNAVFIKAFEEGYENHTIEQIVKEISILADVMTISFKKIYSHGGGGILINRNSKLLADSLERIDKTIKKQTTTEYGNGFDSYSGIIGETMVQIISGLICAIDESVITKRIAQVGYVGLFLREQYNLPVVSGGHALFIAADQILQSVDIKDCPAEYLCALMLNSIQVRGCGLGYLVYGNRSHGNVDKNLSMDSLRLAIPRETYSNEELISRLSLLGKAYQMGLFKNLKGGLIPNDYVNDGFYHFEGRFDLVDRDQFEDAVNKMKALIK